MAEEIDTKALKEDDKDKPRVKKNYKTPYQTVDDQDIQEETEDIQKKEKELTATEAKKMKKKQVKEEQRDKRKLKKELKMAFKNHHDKLVKVNVVEAGGIQPGVSIKKIY